MKVRKFSLFHISLIPVREPNFETVRDITRELWLRKVLSEPFEFPYFAGETLHWVPQQNAMDLLVGVIEKPRERIVHLPPDQGGAETVRQEWQGAYVIIDPTHHEDGQKMSVENDIVGAPQSLVRYLMKYINGLNERPYETEARPIFDENNYLEFLEENGSLLNYVKFHFVVPNMWNTSGNLDKELKETGNDTGTEEVDMTFKSRRGLRGDAKRVIDGVEYASRGAGYVRARSVTGKSFNSNLHPVQTKVETSESDAENGSDNWISQFWKKILGRE
jgi:hypothetical protein